MLNWRQHIHSDPQILLGKAVIKDTRLAIENDTPTIYFCIYG